MMSRPGSESDLDAQVEEALVQNTPNAFLIEYHHVSGIKLLEAVAMHNRLDLIERLFDAGARLSADDLANAIWWSCTIKAAALLLERGTPLNDHCLAAAVRHERWEVLFTFLDYGGNANADIQGASLLHAALWTGSIQGVHAAADLIKHGANPNRWDGALRTPLMMVCDRRNPIRWASEDVQGLAEDLLLENGADVNARNIRGETALLLCVSEKPNKDVCRAKTVQKLLKVGADPNAVSPKGTTALMFAARDNDAPLVRLLLDTGANPALATPQGETARDIAKRYESKTVWRLLGEKSSKSAA